MSQIPILMNKCYLVSYFFVFIFNVHFVINLSFLTNSETFLKQLNYSLELVVGSNTNKTPDGLSACPPGILSTGPYQTSFNCLLADVARKTDRRQRKEINVD